MTDPLEPIRRQCRKVPDAVRWACILEATAPKAGNVHPTRRFADLCYGDFVRAAEVSAVAFEESPAKMSCAVKTAAELVAESIGTNVNLGILLLLGPLVQAETSEPKARGDVETWVAAVDRTLESLDTADTARLYRAISVSKPGGMGTDESMDVNDTPPSSFLAAMESARQRDRIALNYCVGFRDLFDNVVPVVRQKIERRGDVIAGIADAHLELLSVSPDTLIARKFGVDLAEQVQNRAKLAIGDLDRIEAFDAYLRGEDGESDRRLNPGTTADLIAAALYVLLRLTGPGETLGSTDR
ncbi:MAG: triphosphoribosyl-dephospho-CoA synthase [Planctomycetota bacterium]